MRWVMYITNLTYIYLLISETLLVCTNSYVNYPPPKGNEFSGWLFIKHRNGIRIYVYKH